jgi:hypothetical protein
MSEETVRKSTGWDWGFKKFGLDQGLPVVWVYIEKDLTSEDRDISETGLITRSRMIKGQTGVVCWKVEGFEGNESNEKGKRMRRE